MKFWLIFYAFMAPLGGFAAEGPALLKDIAYLEPGRAEKLDLYLPARDETDPPVPAVVWIHGGGWTGGDKEAAPREILLQRAL